LKIQQHHNTTTRQHSETQPPEHSANRETIGVVLFQLGGPDTYDAVEPFLYNLFMDPDIIDFPLAGLIRKPLAKFISSRRSKEVVEFYKQMGQPSPIRDITNQQAAGLRDELRKRDPEHEYHVFVAMRYWHPLTPETIRQIKAVGVDRLILLPLYPHYSKTTTESSYNEWKRCIRNDEIEEIPSKLIESYQTFEPYIDSLVTQIEQGIEDCCDSEEPLHILFSAHGVPKKIIESGDPYKDHIEQTIEAVVKKLSTPYPHHLSFQSKVGPAKWLEPSTKATLEQLGHDGIKHLFVVPVAFVSDHSETLYELNILDRGIAEDAGITHYHVMEGLNDAPHFIDALTQLVLGEV